jgi:hypothetical protein
MVYNNYMNFNLLRYIPQLNNFSWIFIPLVFLELILKGYALWRAGRNNQPYWFIALLVINSVGILPAIYLIFFQPKEKSK